MVISTGSIPKALWPGIHAWYGVNYNEHELECNDLFEVRSSGKSYEEVVEAIGFGLAPEKPEGTATQYADWRQGAVNRFTNRPYSLGFIVTAEEVKDNLYRELLLQRSKRLAFSMRTTKEIVCSNIYNRGFNNSFKYADNKPLFSTSHPSDSGNQSNRLSTDADLSETALEDLIIQIANAKDNAGLQIPIMPKSLHVATSNMFNAERILGSVLQNNTANNAINVLRSMNSLPDGFKVNHYFSDADAWFIRTNAPDSMILFAREEMSFSNDNDFDTGNMKAKSYERYVPGAADWRGIYGTPGG